MPLSAYVVKFVQLMVVPFDHFDQVWFGILPIYTSLILGEMYKSKISFSHAVGNGFVMLWSGLNWARHLTVASKLSYMFDSKALPWLVTAACIGLGVFTIVLGIRKKDKALCEILGHTRFSSYFILCFYPMQTGYIRWNWQSMAAIMIFALPSWFLIYLMGRLASRLAK